MEKERRRPPPVATTKAALAPSKHACASSSSLRRIPKFRGSPLPPAVTSNSTCFLGMIFPLVASPGRDYNLPMSICWPVQRIPEHDEFSDSISSSTDEDALQVRIQNRQRYVRGQTLKTLLWLIILFVRQPWTQGNLKLSYLKLVKKFDAGKQSIMTKNVLRGQVVEPN